MAASALSQWISCFGEMDWLVTDQGSHFKAALMKRLTSEIHIRHHFSTAYFQWSNGAVERMYKEVPRIASALLSEWKLSAGQLPTIVEAIQRILNQSPVEHLEKNEIGKIRCPLEVFTGLKPSPILIRPSPLRRFCDLKIIDQERDNQLIDIERMHNALAQMHKNISENNQRHCTEAHKVHNAKTNVLPMNIEIDCYVKFVRMQRRNKSCKRDGAGQFG